MTLEPAFFEREPRRLTVSRSGVTTDVALDRVNQTTEEFDYFADRSLTDTDPYPDGEHGLVDVRATEAIYRAGGEGTAVDIDRGWLTS